MILLNKIELVFLIIILIFCLVPIKIAEASEKTTPDSCKDNFGGLCIEMQFETASDNNSDEFTSEKYGYPYYTRQGDYLFVKNVYVINKGNEIEQESDLSLQPIPLDYEKLDPSLKEIFFSDYGKWKIHIPRLGPNETFELKYISEFEGWKTYLNLSPNNSDFTLSRVELYKEGEWLLTENRNPSTGYTGIIQGHLRAKNVFQVNAPFQITTLIDAKNSLNYVKYTFWVCLITLGFTVLIYGQGKKKFPYYCKKCNCIHSENKTGYKHLKLD
jgi:hypothetical protein